MKKEHRLSHELPFAGTTRQIIFGLSHGLISILTLLTGLAVAVRAAHSLAITGIVAMFAGAATLLGVEYLSSKSQADADLGILEHEKEEFKQKPKHELAEMERYYRQQGFTAKETAMLMKRITSSEKAWIEAHATHWLGIFPRAQNHAGKDAALLTVSHLVGAMIPLLPYFFFTLPQALIVSLAGSLSAIFIIGALRTLITRKNWVFSGLEMLLIAVLASCISYLIGSLFA